MGRIRCLDLGLLSGCQKFFIASDGLFTEWYMFINQFALPDRSIKYRTFSSPVTSWSLAMGYIGNTYTHMVKDHDILSSYTT